MEEHKPTTGCTCSTGHYCEKHSTCGEDTNSGNVPTTQVQMDAIHEQVMPKTRPNRLVRVYTVKTPEEQRKARNKRKAARRRRRGK